MIHILTKIRLLPQVDVATETVEKDSLQSIMIKSGYGENQGCR